jgi:hypothetical protein
MLDGIEPAVAEIASKPSKRVRKLSKAKLGDNKDKLASEGKQAGGEHGAGDTGFVPVPDSLRDGQPK